MKTWAEFQSASTSSILQWAEKQSWAREMALCMQDHKWHAEGDVWTHTQMVVAELEKLPDWPHLSREEQLQLLFTALFHDSGKPGTTEIDPETGRTRSPSHSLFSMEIAREELRKLGCELNLREKICNLVRYHGRPPYLLEKQDPAHEVALLSWMVNHRLLYLFALADTRGRDTEEMGRPEENLHLWKMVSEENQCFDRPYAFPNDLARFLFLRGDSNNLHYVPHENYRCTVTMMSGLPGAGKDTWLKNHRPDLPVVSLDDIRHTLEVNPSDDQGVVIQKGREACRQYLREGKDFAFNATNTMKVTRRRWVDLFHDYKARVELVYLEPPISKLLEQNQSRENRVPVPVLEKLIFKLESPTWAEAHQVTLMEQKI